MVFISWNKTKNRRFSGLCTISCLQLNFQQIISIIFTYNINIVSGHLNLFPFNGLPLTSRHGRCCYPPIAESEHRPARRCEKCVSHGKHFEGRRPLPTLVNSDFNKIIQWVNYIFLWFCFTIVMIQVSHLSFLKVK